MMKTSSAPAKTSPIDFGYFGLEDLDSLATSLHTGQWRLARVELVNWGTFCGYQILPVDRRGLLITGLSGSGETTLLDAITTVLTPPRGRHLNEAARSSNVRGEDRTIYSYIRGAWRHETDETGEIANSYLRQSVATWSGILLRYENGLRAKEAEGEQPEPAIETSAPGAHEPVNLLVLFHLKAGSNNRDGLSELYAVLRGDHTLDEFEPFAINGCDITAFKREYKVNVQAYRDHAPFTSYFCRLLGIRGNKTLQLLHKTQGAKNFGSLDDLFRKFMLDEPQTFGQATEAVEQFSALSQAHEGVVDQRRQMQHLEPLEKLDTDYQKVLQDLEDSVRIEASLGGYTDSLILQFQQAQQEKTHREADRAAQDVQQMESESNQAKRELQQATASLSEAGGHALQSAELQIFHDQQQLSRIEVNRRKLKADLECAGIYEVPDAFDEWGELNRNVRALAQKAAKSEAASRDANYESFGLVDRLKKEAESINRELRHLRSQDTNIPLSLHRIREDLAAHLDIPVSDLPFTGELMSVRPEYALWQGTIERLLSGQARTLMVAGRHVRAVAEYVESVHLGLRFVYDAVPAEVEVPQRKLHEKSLVRMLAVKHHKAHPEFADWINATLRERFNYVCVESPAELAEHTFALTKGGQIKKKNQHVKDDRHRIDDRSQWVLGDNNEDKIEQLIQKATLNQQALSEAEATAAQISEKTRKAQDLDRLARALEGADWSGYNLISAQSELESSERHFEQLRKSDRKLEVMKRLCDEAQARQIAADDALLQARVAEGKTRETLEEINAEVVRYTQRMETADVVLDEDQQRLARLFKKRNAAYLDSLAAINETSRLVLTDISESGRKANDALQKTRAAAERVMHDYRLEWPTRTADLSEAFEDLNSYLTIYRQIKANGLPDYEQKFLQVLHDFSQDQITVVASTIRRAPREIKEKLEPVNRSLELSCYSPGIHLRIEAKEARSGQVTDFLNELQSVTEGLWSDDDLASAEVRFKSIDRVISRFRSSEYADKSWKQACLDTRQHVSFIARELDSEGAVQNVHGSDAGLSGGQKQKLVIFCLAAALRYQLADEDQPILRYGTVILDEAFDKADHSFATTAMEIFRVFGFHMVLATPLKLLQTLEPHIGEIASVHCRDSRYSSLQIVTIEDGDGDTEGADDGEDAEDA